MAWICDFPTSFTWRPTNGRLIPKAHCNDNNEWHLISMCPHVSPLTKKCMSTNVCSRVLTWWCLTNTESILWTQLGLVLGKSCAVAPKLTPLIGKAKPIQSAKIAYSPLICCQTLTSLVMIFLALQAPTTTPGFLLLKSPMFPPLFLLRVMQFVTHHHWRHRRPNHVVLAPVLCADRTVTPSKQRLRCTYSVCVLFVSLLSLCHLCFCLMQRPFSVHAQLRHAVTHHSACFLQQPFTASLLFFSRYHL